MEPVRRFRVITALSVLLAFLLPVAGCSDGTCPTCGGCAEVACEPSPPLLSVTLLDSILIDDTTWAYLPTTDGTVTLWRQSAGDLFDPRSVPVVLTDSVYVFGEGLPSEVDTVAIVAERGGKRDTVWNRVIRRVAGCCPQTLLGWYTIRL